MERSEWYTSERAVSFGLDGHRFGAFPLSLSICTHHQPAHEDVFNITAPNLFPPQANMRNQKQKSDRRVYGTQ